MCLHSKHETVDMRQQTLEILLTGDLFSLVSYGAADFLGRTTLTLPVTKIHKLREQICN